MARKLHIDEDALELIREIKVHLAAGSDVSEACRKTGISDATYCNWRRKLGGMGRSQLSEIRALEKENKRLKKIVAELELGKESLDFLKAEGLTTEEQRQAVVHTHQKLGTSERRTCRVLRVVRSTIQYRPGPDDDNAHDSR